MSKKEKLLARLKAKPKNFTFDEAETLLLSFGCIKSNKGKTSGSRVLFYRNGSPFDLHKPHPRKELHGYQITKLINFLKKEGLI